jgi:hypothetical protein
MPEPCAAKRTPTRTGANWPCDQFEEALPWRPVNDQNRETPSAALPAGASAPHRAFQGWEPSTSDRSPGVTLRPIKVIARQSLRSGGRFALSTPPAPVTRFGHANGRFLRSGCPVRSSPTCRRLHPGCPEHPVSTTPPPPFPGCPVPTSLAANDPPPTSLPSREPGWISIEATSPKGSTTRSRPFLGPRLACACRCVAYFALPVSPGQAVFLNTQGYPPDVPDIPRSFWFVHHSYTG